MFFGCWYSKPIFLLIKHKRLDWKTSLKCTKYILLLLLLDFNGIKQKYITSKNIIIINDKDNYWYEFYRVQKPLSLRQGSPSKSEMNVDFFSFLTFCQQKIFKQQKINSKVSNWHLTYIALELNYINERCSDENIEII